MTSDDRRIPVWVPLATAVAGALVGFGLVTTLATDGDDTDAELATVETRATTTDSEAVSPESDERSIPTPEPTAAPGDTATLEPPVTPAVPTPQPSAVESPAAQQPSGAAISRQQAGSIAAAHVGGTVDSIDREHDDGAAWDVDVYAPDGEYTIYLSAAGEIVRVEGPFRD